MAPAEAVAVATYLRILRSDVVRSQQRPVVGSLPDDAPRVGVNDAAAQPFTLEWIPS